MCVIFLCTYVFICMYICVFMNVSIQIYTCMYISLHIHMYVNKKICLYTNIQIYIYIYASENVSDYVSTYVCGSGIVVLLARVPFFRWPGPFFSLSLSLDLSLSLREIDRFSLYFSLFLYISLCPSLKDRQTLLFYLSLAVSLSLSLCVFRCCLLCPTQRRLRKAAPPAWLRRRTPLPTVGGVVFVPLRAAFLPLLRVVVLSSLRPLGRFFFWEPAPPQRGERKAARCKEAGSQAAPSAREGRESSTTEWEEEGPPLN